MIIVNEVTGLISINGKDVWLSCATRSRAALLTHITYSAVMTTHNYAVSLLGQQVSIGRYTELQSIDNKPPTGPSFVR